ncbi:hypothetical protein BCR41DRAFT_365537 [Lobosporangium transversale]|uniref:Uncharacterized protein n=1 Tax=Lobosporangium transversale TaxID=64571 RepID=A0A1Y2G7H1_9FUNG|nr:hypothetical protein BCR41DRAFT_365537 [Lobosporangium transversale]ORY93681.1 hypothetical protein BCR41DRAFT_365537 [Lobosporangium transversale]|eukprot:XP_021875176.1 hypothetical protein BCR41DRAFT_365537 [Lobosporangium transversale]
MKTRAWFLKERIFFFLYYCFCRYLVSRLHCMVVQVRGSNWINLGSSCWYERVTNRGGDFRLLKKRSERGFHRRI